MKNDPSCIKEDVCDMAVCDGVSSCSHAVLKTAVLAQQTTNNESMPCEIGVYDDPCKLGYPCKCKHGCLIKRTAYIS